MKNWMFIFADIGGLVVSLFVMKSFFIMFGEKRFDSKWLNFLADFLFIGISTILNVFKFNQIVFAVLFYLVLLAYTFIYVIKPFRRFYSSLVCYILFIVGEMLMGLLISAISKMTVEEIIQNIVYYSLNSIATKLILYAIIKPISSYVVCKSNSIPKLAMVAFIFLPVTTVSILYFLSVYFYKNNSSNVQIICFILSLLLIISNMVVFFIFYYVSKQKDKEKYIETKTKQLEYERQYYSDLHEKQTVSDKVTHDLKNKFFAINSLLKDNPARAEEEMAEILATFEEVSLLKITGNSGIDALLNHKFTIAKANNIKTKVLCCIGSIQNIDIVDLCVIIGNLLDNSIEACLKVDEVEKRFISVNLKQELQFLKITIANSYTKENNVGKTSKKDTLHHGFGKDNVKEIVDKYNGYYTVTEEENQYVVIVGVEDKNN